MNDSSVMPVTVPRDIFAEASPQQLAMMADRARLVALQVATADQALSVLRFLDLVHHEQRRKAGPCR
jgi:hypothetical protein